MTAISTASAVPLAVNLLSPHSLLSTFGAAGIFVVMFAETGLLIGFFLPGDSLLFTAGVLCATRANSPLHLSLPSVLVAAAGGALLGAQTGFLLGRAAGPSLLSEQSRPKLAHGAERARIALERYGTARALVLARFIPVVRTVVNPLAGALRTPAMTFTAWQVVGGLAWSLGVTFAGWQLGSRISNIDRYLLPIVAVVVVGSFMPILIEWRRARRSASGAGNAA